MKIPRFEICCHCGAEKGLHHYETMQCPEHGVEAPIGKKQHWENTKFNPTIILNIHDAGDWSVGLFPQSWNIECPFGYHGLDDDTLEFFREEQLKIYKEFADGKISAYYNFENID